jgi:hypothetical protein
MKKSCQKIFVLASMILSFNTWSQQCLNLICPADVSVMTDQGVCGAVVNFIPPQGIDTCANNSQTFDYTGSIETFTVPAGVTSISVQAYGAQGGNTNGGLGAGIYGEFNVNPGDQFSVVVGQQGVVNNCGGANASGGGGGGSFFWDPNNTALPLIAAGGGGGGNGNWGSPCSDGIPGQAGNDGTAGSEGLAAGGTAGQGGSGNAPSGTGSGGGGWLSPGENSTFGTGCTGGETLPTFFGGDGSTSFNPGGEGGFGGGGGAVCGCGGGGGFSGGAGGNGSSCRAGGGGGGSYNQGSAQVNQTGVNSGDGQVIISWTSSTVTTNQTGGLPSGSTFPVGTTIQTFQADDGNGNTISCSFTIEVISDLNVNLNSSNIINGNDGTISTTVTGGTSPYSFSWNGPGGYTSTDQNLTDLNAPGTYELTVTDDSGCEFTIDIILDSEVGLEEYNSSLYSIFPNPNMGSFTIDLKEQRKYVQIKVLDMQGRLIKEKIYNNIEKTQMELNVNHGVYTIIIIADKNKSVKKLIID